jgi:hypothetical protein
MRSHTFVLVWIALQALVLGSIAMHFGEASAQSSPSPSPQPSMSPGPTSTGTAQASPPTPPTIHSAITDLAVETVLSTPGAVPIVRLTWSAPADYTGDFQIEHARVDSANPTARRDFASAGTVSSSTRSSSGRYVYEEPDVRGVQSCYRARTLVAGVGGPYTTEVCAVNPLLTGPGSTTPAPPSAGGGGSAKPARLQYRVSVLEFGVVLAGLGLAVAFWSRRGAPRVHRG